MELGAVKISEGVHWVGALDPELRVFDIIMKTEHGTTYNAYLIQGSEKTALVETVKIKFIDQLIERVKEITGLENIDYIVHNHLEPDHSGSLSKMLELCPNARVVVSKTAPRFLENILNRNVGPLIVSDGDQIDLGGKTLSFFHAPFLHWPDTMFTYVAENKFLLTCDVFGCHYCDPRMFNDAVDSFDHAYKYYFNVIMRPFKKQMRTALDKITDLPIDVIGPSHGPVLRENPARYINMYREWSSGPAKSDAKKLLIFYLSIYDNTAKMARTIAGAVEEEGVGVMLFDIIGTDISQALDIIESADGLLVGSPTINGDAIKPAWDLLSSMATINIKGKIGGSFGSFGWSGEAVKMIESRLKSLKFKVVENGPRSQLVPNDQDLENCISFAKEVAKAIKD
jgi:NADH oxidase (H2O-forming)